MPYLIVGVALAVRLYQLSRPGYLYGITEYDDGVYVGETIRLAHGVLPYRSYVIVQPPGISELLLPLGLFVRVVGSDTILASCRVLTVLVDTASVVVVGALTRHRGRAVQVLAMAILAVYPATVSAAHTVLLEPYLNLSCLLGAWFIFRNGRLARARSVAVAGLLFGVAAAIKVWAMLPVLAVIVVLFPGRNLRREAAFIGGVAAGFAVLVTPIAAFAPRRFFRETIIDQLIRHDVGRVSFRYRLEWIWSTANIPHVFQPLPLAIVISVFLVLGVLVLVANSLTTIARGDRRNVEPLLTYSLLSLSLTVAAFLVSDDFYYHYGSFVGPFLSISIALGLSLLTRRARRIVGAVIIVAVVGAFATDLRSISESNAPGAATALSDIVPAGDCVLTDSPSLTITSDRFSSHQRGCPELVDGFGTTIAQSGGYTAAALDASNSRRAVLSQWEVQALEAQFVAVSSFASGNIPDLASFIGFLNAHYKLVRVLNGEGRLYERTRNLKDAQRNSPAEGDPGATEHQPNAPNALTATTAAQAACTRCRSPH